MLHWSLPFDAGFSCAARRPNYNALSQYPRSPPVIPSLFLRHAAATTAALPIEMGSAGRNLSATLGISILSRPPGSRVYRMDTDD